MTPPREPRTAAGRELLRLLPIVPTGPDTLRDHIAKIEAEAGAPLREALEDCLHRIGNMWGYFEPDSSRWARAKEVAEQAMADPSMKVPPDVNYSQVLNFMAYLRGEAALAAPPAPAPLDEPIDYSAAERKAFAAGWHKATQLAIRNSRPAPAPLDVVEALKREYGESPEWPHLLAAIESARAAAAEPAPKVRTRKAAESARLRAAAEDTE